MLHILLRNGTYFSLIGCFTQFFLFGVFLATENFLLSAMSYDRFLAICKPLHYTLIMGPGLCICLILACWALSILLISIGFSFVISLNFCRDNIIDHFYCDVLPILKLSFVMIVSSFSSATAMLPLLVIISTYGFIIRAITRISSSKGKKKAFSTCSSPPGSRLYILFHHDFGLYDSIWSFCDNEQSSISALYGGHPTIEPLYLHPQKSRDQCSCKTNLAIHNQALKIVSLLEGNLDQTLFKLVLNHYITLLHYITSSLYSAKGFAQRCTIEGGGQYMKQYSNYKQHTRGYRALLFRAYNLGGKG
ncbi:unnamed protein product [Staurois parvus]|uniref:G-protein coupled receptors family 1 profile domain-containing protein n=1 Tax=Staurois parvus TaxID=386267 RepID=A0ABN9H6W3_9NEOB|nr:unnamed protein product [Staurois parvus]